MVKVTDGISFPDRTGDLLRPHCLRAFMHHVHSLQWEKGQHHHRDHRPAQENIWCSVWISPVGQHHPSLVKRCVRWWTSCCGFAGSQLQLWQSSAGACWALLLQRFPGCSTHSRAQQRKASCVYTNNKLPSGSLQSTSECTCVWSCYEIAPPKAVVHLVTFISLLTFCLLSWADCFNLKMGHCAVLSQVLNVSNDWL